jgi:hypothetical protein
VQRFSEKIMPINELKRDDDSTKFHRALGAMPRNDGLPGLTALAGRAIEQTVST